jgi:hypothetical protein
LRCDLVLFANDLDSIAKNPVQMTNIWIPQLHFELWDRKWGLTLEVRRVARTVAGLARSGEKRRMIGVWDGVSCVIRSMI